MVATFACQPKPNESVYSLISRRHVQSGEKSPYTTLISLTGIRGYKPISGLPTKLTNIANNLAIDGGVKKLVNYHSHFRLYAHFLNEERRKLLLEAMVNAGSPKSRLGILASKIGAREILRSCPDCINEDIFQFGFPYWHREHSVSGVFVCSRHKRYLLEEQLSGIHGDRKLFLPSVPGLDSMPIKDINIWEKLSYVSEQLDYLLRMEPRSPIITSVYKNILIERGLLTVNGRVRQREIESLAVEWLSDLVQLPIFEKLRCGLQVERNWLAELIAGKKGFHHPLKHLVFWAVINSNATEMVNTASAFGEQLELDLKTIEPLEITPELLKCTIDKCGTLTRAAAELKTTITTIAAYADIYNIK